MEQHELEKRIERLEAENRRLRQLLKMHGISLAKGEHDMEEGVAKESMAKDSVEKDPMEKNPMEKNSAMFILAPEKKIALFRSLFRGREDVFARRWYSTKTGKGGYQPVCLNEWGRQICDKRKYKCTECPNRQFAPLTDDYIYQHLAGKDEWGRDVIGVYAILGDDTCYFLCSDFDDKNCTHGYQNDVLAFTAVCKDWAIPYAIERSRSGNGAHVWILFDQPTPAAKARRMGDAILTEAMNRDSRVSFRFYDRFFPNQDHLPEGGLGNLVALPLQGWAHKQGNSVFVLDNFEAYADQWEYLQSIRKMGEEAVDDILTRHSDAQEPFGALAKGTESTPWELPRPSATAQAELPKALTVIRSNMIYIPLKELPPQIVNHLKRIATFKNPEFFSRMGMRLSTYNIPRIISCAELTEEWLALPRGCEEAVEDFFDHCNVTLSITDKTNHGQPIDVTFRGILREDQHTAVATLLLHNTGVLSATTAFGKTVTAIAMISQLKVNTLILVHNRALLKQWTERLQQFLSINEIPKREKYQRSCSPIGCLYAGKSSLHGIVDVALIQSCLSEGEAKPFVRNYGLIIVDECHHVSAVGFEQVLKFVNARYVYGLTATPIRKNGHQPIIFMQCGPIRYKADAQQQIGRQSFSRLLIPRFTSFRLLSDDKPTYMQLLHELANDNLRNQLIVHDIAASLQEGRTPLVLSRLTAQVEILAQQIRPLCKNVIVLTGSKSDKEKKEIEEQLQGISATDPMVILSTDRYIGEGFDFPRLDTLFLTLPISWKGNVEQCVGRLHRSYEGKQEVRVYDYIDIRIPLGDVMYKRRLKGYRAAGYTLRQQRDTPNDNKGVFYCGTDFLRPFLDDLSRAHHSVVIACRHIRLYRQSVFKKLLNLQANGIDVVVYISKEGYDEKKLAAAGLDVRPSSAPSLHCVLIDKTLYWYGDIDYLGYCSPSDNAIRGESIDVAAQLLDVVCSSAKG